MKDPFLIIGYMLLGLMISFEINAQPSIYEIKQHIQDDPIEPALENRGKLVRWFIKIHNKVNQDLGKPQYTYEQVIEEYKYKLMNVDRDETMVYKVIIGALLLFIVFKFLKK